MIESVNLTSKLNAEGKVKVELFDDLTGKKIEEIKTNNFIAKGVEYYFKILMMNQFTRNKGTGSIEHTVDNLFERMTLTDASHPEQPEKEWYMKGNEIGWALTSGTYSGSDEKRGSYNTAESFTTQEQVHIVVDFPTHAANGTFQSIYFTPNGNPPNFGIFRPFVLDGLTGVLKVQKYNNEIWVLHSNDTRNRNSVGNFSNRSISRYDDNFNHIETYNLPYSKYDFYIHNNYIYYTEGTFSRGLQRAPLSNPTNLTTIIDEYINGDEALAGIVFDHKNNQFVICSGTSSSSTGGTSSSISRYDTSFNLLSNTPYVFPNGGYFYQKMFITDDGDIFVSGYERSYIVQNDKAEMDAKIGLVMGAIDDYKIMRDGDVMPQIGISSRALLDAPVTKTSNTTMKITYDFMLPSLM